MTTTPDITEAYASETQTLAAYPSEGRIPAMRASAALSGDADTARLSRRTTLKWLAAVMSASQFAPYRAARARPFTDEPVPKGYGRDPDLNHPVVPWPRTLTPRQLQLIAVLADLILPGTDSAPAPSALGIPDFVDEWVSAPYPQQRADRAVVLDGLRWLDEEAERRWQREFLQITGSQQQQLLDATVAADPGIRSRAQEPTWPTPSSETLKPVPKSFFSRFRFIVVGAYYTTPEGFKGIGYIGNVLLPSYPPISEQEKAVLDAQLRSLGISVT
jgi:hypothetical protein